MEADTPLTEEPVTTEAEDAATDQTPADDAGVPDSGAENAAERENDGDEDAGNDKDAAPEFIEVEFEGRTYNLPPELKDALLRQSDYTRKTQTVAEEKRTFEAQKAQFEQQVNLHHAFLNDLAQVRAVEAQLKQFEGIDWNALYDSDPTEAQKLDRWFRDLKDQRTDAQTRVQQAQRKAIEDMQAQRAKALEKGHQELAKEFPGWSQNQASELGAYAQSQGYSPAEIANFVDYRSMRVLHKARLYDQLMAKRQQKPTPSPSSPLTRSRASPLSKRTRTR